MASLPIHTVARRPLSGVLEVYTVPHHDERGWFRECYSSVPFQRLGIPPLVVWNTSQSAAGVLRGLHYQPGLGKWVRCTRGALFDVALDLRPDSPTYGQHANWLLLADAPLSLYLPPGIAHGFLAILPASQCSYGMTAEWSPKIEGAIRWDSAGIPWPLSQVAGAEATREVLPLLSARDAKAPTFSDYQQAPIRIWEV